MVAFVVQDGYINMNASLAAFTRTRQAFSCMAEELGLETEDNAVRMVKELRAEK